MGLRQMRETGNLLSTRISELHRLRRKLFPGDFEKKVGPEAAPRNPVASAPAMADPSNKLKPTSVEDALAMLMDKKSVQYRGGLSGIVHAAGVQEMTAFQAHSPAKFEYVF